MKDLFERVKSHAKEQPFAPCLICPLSSKTWSYKEVVKEVHLLEKFLHHQGIKKGDRVALYGENSPEVVLRLLALWNVGATVCPMQKNTPRRELDIAAAWGLVFEKKKALLPPSPEVACLISTSGSTGPAKIVAVPHQRFPSLWQEQSSFFNINCSSICSWMLSFDFDASLSDIGAALWAGAALVCVPAKRWLSGRQFFKDSAQWKITHIDAPPAWLSLISHLDPPSSLQTIIAGGEVTPPVLLKRWGDRVNWCNVYGPTESTVCTSMERRNSKDVSQTIGQPMKEVVYALKTEKGLRLLPSSGEKGELYIYCQGNGFYWNDEEKNQTRFEYLEDKKFFKTRDLVEKTDNNWLFIGRMDRIVKQHGVFVDLDLVERDVLQKKGVTSAACVQTQGAVTVFYTGTCPERDIVKMFSGIRVCKKEKLPVKNSKIDKKSLEKDAGGV